MKKKDIQIAFILIKLIINDFLILQIEYKREVFMIKKKRIKKGKLFFDIIPKLK